VIFFRAKKSLEGRNLGHNLPRIDFGRLELPDICASDALLLLVGIENGGAVLRPIVRTLAV